MEQNINEIELLLSVIDMRETLYTEHNRKIAEIITPTVLTALFELFELPSQHVVWDDFLVIDSILVIRVTVTCNTAESISPFLSVLAPSLSQAKSAVHVQRTMQFGIPLAKVFQDKEQLKTWFIDVANRTSTESPASSPPVDEFKDVQLTAEQKLQVEYFSQIHGEKQ